MYFSDDPAVDGLSQSTRGYHGFVASDHSMGADWHSNILSPPPDASMKREPINMSESPSLSHYLIRDSPSKNIARKMSEDSCDLILMRQESSGAFIGDNFLPICQENVAANRRVVAPVADNKYEGLKIDYKPNLKQKKVFTEPLATLKSCFPTLSDEHVQKDMVENAHRNTISERNDMLAYLNDLTNTCSAENDLPSNPKKVITAAKASDLKKTANQNVLLSHTLSSLSSVLKQRQCEKQKRERRQLVGYSSSDEEIQDSEKLENQCDDGENPSGSTKNTCNLGFDSPATCSSEKRKFSDVGLDDMCPKQRVTSPDKSCAEIRTFLTPKTHRLYSWKVNDRKQLFRSSSDSSVAHMPQMVRNGCANVKLEYRDQETSNLQVSNQTIAMVNGNKIDQILKTSKETRREVRAPSMSSRKLLEEEIQAPNILKNTNSSDSESLDTDFSFASQESIEKPYFFDPSSQPPPPSPYFSPKTFWRAYGPSSSPLTTYTPSLLGGGVMQATAHSPYASLMGAFSAPNMQPYSGISPLMNSMGISRRGHFSYSAGHIPSKAVSSDQSETRSENSTPVSNWKARMKERANNYGVNFIDSHCHIDFLYRNENFQGSFTKYRRLNSDTFPYTFEGCVAVFCRPESFQSQG